jgi:serine phosphatase RsbU (regulator of sigma subunit)
MKKLCRMLLDRVMLRVPARAGAVLLTNGRSGRATIRAAVNLAKMSGDIFFSDRTVFDKVQRDKEKKSCILNESRLIPTHLLGPLAEEKALRSLMVVPLHWKRRTLGLLVLMDRERSEPGFTSEDSHLAESIATPFAAILHNRRLADYRMEIRKEMQIARRLHKCLMQTELPEIPGLQIGTVMQRGGKSEIGGDYFDWHQTTDGSRLRATIIDVSGHGIASSLMMVLARAIIKSEARTLSSPREILRRMNEDLYPQFSRSELFLTGFLLEIENLGPHDATKAHLRYANAGHPPPLLLRGNEPLERSETLATDGLPVGILPSYTFEEKEKILAPGDVLVLYTDGVTEARSVKKRLFGEKRLGKTAYEARAGTAEQIARAIDDTVSRYRDPDPEAHKDDHAIVVIKKT